MNLDLCLKIGKEIVTDRYGGFENEPEDFEVKEGLLEQGKAGYTKSITPVEEDEGILWQSSESNPQKIVLDKSLVENRPDAACKTLLHELIEWRGAEAMHSNDVISGSTDYVAEFLEGSMCREANARADERICDLSWNRELDT